MNPEFEVLATLTDQQVPRIQAYLPLTPTVGLYVQAATPGAYMGFGVSELRSSCSKSTLYPQSHLPAPAFLPVDFLLRHLYQEEMKYLLEVQG